MTDKAANPSAAAAPAGAANPSAAAATGATAAPAPAAAQPAAPSSKAPEPTAPSPAAPSPAPSAAAAAAPAAAPDPRLEQLHRVMLMMLKDFAALCEKEGLRWYAAFGTAIGALRHAGFVPWDDDIDLYMPRAHLDRLVQAAQQGRFAQRYCVVNASLDARYPLATTRVMLRGTEFRDEALASMDFESGIFLDLFPLDDLADDERAFRRQAWRAWLYNKLAIAKATRRPYVAGPPVRVAVLRAGAACMRGLLKLPGLRAIDFNRRSLAWQTRHAGKPTRRVGYLCDTNRFWDVYAREDFEPARMVPFEDTAVPLPCHAERMLEALYGDFMTPPPENLRHEHYPHVLDFGPYANL